MAAQSSYLPLKVNYSGVMPVIFASAILLFLQQIFNMAGAGLHWRFMSEAAATLMRGSWVYYSFYGFLILIFSYFWVSVMFKPVQVADELKKHGGYIPGVRPGEATAKFLDFSMTRLTLAGAIFLTIIAVIPDVLLFEFKVPYKMAQFFGGTGMLITVGVLLETMRQVETYLLQRHYDGFLQKGHIRSTSMGRTRTLMDTQEVNNLAPLWITVSVLFGVGFVAWAVNTWVLKA
jgi:preprotein translocase subunit SecY